MDKTLADRVAIVTGGAGGIGSRLARAYTSAGAHGVIASRRQDKLDELASELSANGPGALAIATDVTVPDDVANLVDSTVDAFGRLDILVNNAGGAMFVKPPLDLKPDEWNAAIALNLTSVFLCSQAAARIMMDLGGGRIINVGSIAAQKPRHSSSPYTTSKHAVWGLTQSLALEGREHGIAVSALHPGNVAVERRADGKSATGRDEGPEPLIATEDMGRTALLMATLPPDSNMLEAIVLTLGQDYLGRG